MRHIVDLTRDIYSEMPVYPGDPEVALRPALSVPEDGVAVCALHLGSHTGTHIDAPCHSIVGGRTIAEVSLTELCGELCVLDLSTLPVTNHTVDTAAAAALLPETLPEIVFLNLGVAKDFGTPEMLAHPGITCELAAQLWERGARVLGVDALSPDPTSLAAEQGLPVHDFWLGRDGLIVENLTGLENVRCGMSAVIAPLPLRDSDGSPVRVFAY